MITEEQHLEAKKKFVYFKNILREYNLQPREKRNAGRLKRKPFSDDEIKKGIENIFESDLQFRYKEIVFKIKTEFKTGECFAKSMLTDFQNKCLIIKVKKRYYINK